MRIWIAGFFCALIFLLPAAGDVMNFRPPLAGLLTIPATGLDYMAVFFHELGHTVANWSFGYPALPSFDFQNGGGMTYDFERSYLLLIAFYLLAGVGIFKLYRLDVYYIPAAILLALHAGLAFTDGHQAAVSYMGHGGEVLIGCFCLMRAMTGTAGRGVEPFLNVLFAVFVFGRNLILLGGLVFSDIARMAYDMQKGQHGFGDFSRLADVALVSIQTAAGLALVVMVFLYAVTAFLSRPVDEDVLP